MGWVNIVRGIHRGVKQLIGWGRLLPLRCLGLRGARGLIVKRSVRWPMANLRNMVIGECVELGIGGWFYLPLDNPSSRIEIGSGTCLGDEFVVSANELVRIGRNCLISYRVSILDHGHVVGWGIDPNRSGLTPGKTIEIGDRCFIGCNAVILPGVRLGENCIVGANSVVNRSFPAGSVLAGAPAQLLRQIGPQETEPTSAVS